MYVVLNVYSTCLTSLELTVYVTYKCILIYVLKELMDFYLGIIKCAEGTDCSLTRHGGLGGLRLL